MNFLAWLLLTPTYNNCPIQQLTYQPLVVEACGQVYLSIQPGLATYSHEVVLTIPGLVFEDRIFQGDFQ